VNYRLHPNFSWRAEAIGREGQRVVVIDNFLVEAEALVEQAAGAAFAPAPETLYPGVRARLALTYTFVFRDQLADVFREAFALDVADIAGGQTDFSVVTTPPRCAHVRQLYPHFDGPDPNIIAGLHYLCDGANGGTSFYRHRATGYEVIGREREGAYVEALKGEIARSPPRTHYPCGDSDLFERIASFPAVFNRLLIYRGAGLHSGDIGADFGFDPNPRTGRLTANTFLAFRPR
jgi:hypothetical protein